MYCGVSCTADGTWEVSWLLSCTKSENLKHPNHRADFDHLFPFFERSVCDYLNAPQCPQCELKSHLSPPLNYFWVLKRPWSAQPQRVCWKVGVMLQIAPSQSERESLCKLFKVKTISAHVWQPLSPRSALRLTTIGCLETKHLACICFLRNVYVILCNSSELSGPNSQAQSEPICNNHSF